MAKGIYIGASTPVYDMIETTIDCIDWGVLLNYFQYSSSADDNAFNFVYDTNGEHWYSENSDYGKTEEQEEYNDSFADMYLTALQDIKNISLTCRTDSEENYDELSVIVQSRVNGSSEVMKISGQQTETWSGAINKNDTIHICYNKDSSVHSGQDRGYVEQIIITIDIPTEKDPPEYTNVAKKVKSLYVGVNGICRNVTKGYVNVEGINRQYFPNTSNWQKYACTIIQNPYYEEKLTENVHSFGVEPSKPNYKAYSYYGFNEQTGQFQLSGPTIINIGDDLEVARQTLIGLYVFGFSNIKQIQEVKDFYYVENLDNTAHWFFDFIGTNHDAQFIPGQYSIGSFIDTVSTELNTLPQAGTLIEGSVDDGYCVMLENNNIAYYYILQT